MFFTVGIITELGKFDIKKFFNHDEAFNYSIALEKPDIFPYVSEKQWSVTESKLVYKTYFVRSGSVFREDNALEAVYSNSYTFKPVEKYRKSLIKHIENASEIYKYRNMVSPYTSEYCHCLTLKEMQTFAHKMMSDPVIVEFATTVVGLLEDIKQSISFTCLDIENYKKDLYLQPVNKKIPFLKDCLRRLKAVYVANFYGGSSCVELFISNSLTPYN